MTFTIKNPRSASVAKELLAAAPYFDQRARNERTNRVIQTLWKSVPLRSCSIPARGLWIDLMCVMHECEPYGHLVVNGAPMNVQQLARIVGGPPNLINKLLTELWRAGAFGCKGNCIYSPEMVARDEQGEIA